MKAFASTSFLCSNEYMDFARYVESFQNLYLEAKGAPVPKLSHLSSLISFAPRKILILAPHPDDECLMAGFPLRAQNEFQSQVAVLPFSYGSKRERRSERKQELSKALAILGFDFFDSRLNLKSDEELTAPELKLALNQYRPDVLLTTHSKDGHPAHIRSAVLAQTVAEAYVRVSQRTLHWLQSEFWQSMEQPNLLIPLAAAHLTQMGEAIRAHQGEVTRNPYHLTLPAWAMEQVRRGSEMKISESGVRSSGSTKEECVFGQIYRLDTLTP